MDAEEFKKELTARHRKRGALKGKVTTQLNAVMKYATIAPQNTDQATIILMKEYMEKADKAFEAWEEYHEEVYDFCVVQKATDAQIAKEQAEYDGLQTVYQDVKDKYVERMVNWDNHVRMTDDKKREADLEKTAAIVAASAKQAVTTADPAFVPAPLEPFDPEKGGYIRFKQGWNLICGRRPEVKKAQKLRELITHLRGEALSAVQKFDYTDANYDKVWAELDERFGNMETLYEMELAKMNNVDAVTVSDAKKLQVLYDTLNTAWSNLKGLGKTLPPDEFVLMTWEKKFPRAIQAQLERKKRTALRKKEAWGVPQFLQLVQEEIDISRTLELKNPKKTDAANSGGGSQKKKTAAAASKQDGNAISQVQNKTPSANTNQGGGKNQQSNQGGQSKKGNGKGKGKQSNATLTCFVCGGPHMSFRCSTFLGWPPEKRLDFMTKEDRCKRCFEKHDIDKCGKTFSCVICNSPGHNTLLHCDRTAAKSWAAAAAGANKAGGSDSD